MSPEAGEQDDFEQAEEVSNLFPGAKKPGEKAVDDAIAGRSIVGIKHAAGGEHAQALAKGGNGAHGGTASAAQDPNRVLPRTYDPELKLVSCRGPGGGKISPFMGGTTDQIWELELISPIRVKEDAIKIKPHVPLFQKRSFKSDSFFGKMINGVKKMGAKVKGVVAKSRIGAKYGVFVSKNFEVVPTVLEYRGHMCGMGIGISLGLSAEVLVGDVCRASCSPRYGKAAGFDLLSALWKGRRIGDKPTPPPLGGGFVMK